MKKNYIFIVACITLIFMPSIVLSVFGCICGSKISQQVFPASNDKSQESLSVQRNLTERKKMSNQQFLSPDDCSVNSFGFSINSYNSGKKAPRNSSDSEGQARVGFVAPPAVPHDMQEARVKFICKSVCSKLEQITAEQESKNT